MKLNGNWFILLIILPLLLLSLTACATQNTAAQAVSAQSFSATTTPSAPQELAVLDAQATLNAYSYRLTMTAEAQFATLQAQQATAQAQQTLSAIMVATATGQAVNATATSVVQATQVAGQMTVDVHNLQLQMTRTQADINATATIQQSNLQSQLDQALISAEVTRTYQNARIQDISLERQQIWNRWLPVFYAFALFVFVLALGFMSTIAGRVVWLRLNPIVIIESDRPVLVRDGYKALPGRMLEPNRLLPAPQPVRSNHGAVTVTSSNSLRTPRWSGFIRFIKEGDKNLIPLGLSAGGPLFVNRKEEPHGLLVGTTGAGKSKSGVVPFAAGMAASGIHVVAVNGRGSDFNALIGRPNITLAPHPGRRELLPLYLETVVSALVAEADKRDKLLQEHNIDHWGNMPAEFRTGPEIALIIDEFLGIVDMAHDIMNDRTNTAEERAFYQTIIFNLWRNLKVIVKECRKHGLYLFITATDPTAESLGKDGMQLRRQMFRMVFRMKESASSRAILGNTKGSDYPNGSVGLGTGQFLFTVGSEVQLAAGFFPTAAEISELFQAVVVQPTRLPDLVREAVFGGIETPNLLSNDQARQMVRAEVNGRSLDDLARSGEICSLNKVALELSDGNETNKASGEEYQLAVEALTWRIQTLNCSWAKEVAQRSSGKYGDELRQYVYASRLTNSGGR